MITVEVVKDLRANNVPFSNRNTRETWKLTDMFFWLIYGAVGFSLLKGPGGLLSGFGIKKKLVEQQENTGVTFADVAGIDEAKNELQEIVDFLKNPDKYLKVGAKIPKGVLLSGPPGVGKTLLAKAIAGEAGVPFFSLSGSDFVGMFVGLGAKNVNDMFDRAPKKSPSIIFIDEIDAIGGSRDKRMGSGADDERDQTLNALLVRMDGLVPEDRVIIIGATNLVEKLDRALLRPGRFDRKVEVSLPDALGREKILAVHSREVSLGDDVSLQEIAKTTQGFSGAELANLVNEAAIHAAQLHQDTVLAADFTYAVDKITLGLARRSMVLTDEQKRLLAFHEAGHAITGLHQSGSDQIEKATIVPRGKGMGLVKTVSDGERYSYTREEFEARLVSLFGGREAERLVFGEEKVTTGASSDIEVATNIARQMVTVYGMSSMGQVHLAPKDDWYPSESTARKADRAVSNILKNAQQQACKILSEHRVELDAVANELLAQETLSGEQIKMIAENARRGQIGSVPEPA
jgi:cell division protease FtsH